jgi:hypothetical protein
LLRTTGALLGAGDLSFLSQLPGVSRADARIDARAVRFHPDIEPLVRLLEETPRAALLEEVATRIKRGLNYRELLAALLLAGVRNIQPRPVGFKFHAVLVVNSAHLASLASPDSDRWLPIFWALDHFKESQARDVREGDWTMGPVNESATPGPAKARQAFIEAMNNWDEAAADVAVADLVRGAEGVAEMLAVLHEASDEEACDRVIGQLNQGVAPQSIRDAFFLGAGELLINTARRLIFLKGNNAHDYKFSSAVLEDYYHVSPAWRDRYLAASVFNLRGSGGPDNSLVQRTRAALQA